MDLVQLVSQLGFPIAVAVCAMGMIWKQTQHTQEFLEQELRSRDDRTNVLLQEVRQGVQDVRKVIELVWDHTKDSD